VLACLSRRRSWVQIPSGTLDKTARYANRQSGEAQTFVNVCGFNSHPCYSRTTCVGWALAGLAGCKPAVRTDPGGSTPSRRTQTRFVYGAVRCWSCSEAFNLANAGSIPVRVAVLARCDVGFAVRPSTWPTRTSIPVRVTGRGQVVEFGRHATLRRSCPQGRASSNLALATDRTTAGGQGPNWLSYGRCARFDTGTCNLRVGQCSSGPHKPGPPVCDSRTRDCAKDEG
jgi:hypothetical protein